MRKPVHVKYYSDRRGKFRWRIRSQNGNIIGCSSQGFATLAAARHNAILLTKLLGEVYPMDTFNKTFPPTPDA